MEKEEIEARKTILLSYTAQLISSARRHGNERAMLSEELTELIVNLANSSLDFNDLEQFEKAKLRIEDFISGM